VSVIRLAAALPDRDAGTKHLPLDGPPVMPSSAAISRWLCLATCSSRTRRSRSARPSDDPQPADDVRALRLAGEQLEPRIRARLLDRLRPGRNVAGDQTVSRRVDAEQVPSSPRGAGHAAAGVIGSI
jgi:hypothetical protein